MAKQKKSARKAKNSKPAPQSLGDAMDSVLMAVYGQKQQQTAAALLDASSAVEAAAEDLKLHDRKAAADHTESAADWLETAAQRVIRMEPSDLTDVLSDAAEKNPALFIGGAALGGAALVLWLRSLNQRAAAGQ